MKGDLEKQQRHKYLDRFKIDRANIQSIGAGRTAMLSSYGIETAADIYENSLRRIPEFNDVLRNELLDWKKLMEERFRFNPSKGMDPSGVQALIHKFQPRMRPIERELRLGIETLHEIQQKTMKARTRFQPMVEKSARDLAQAQADMEVF
jgi:DNA-binding helix-hairpin-helix protein with protein kinase domain